MRMVVVRVVIVMVMAVDRRAGDLVADKEDHGFEKVGEPTRRCCARPQHCCQTREQQEQDAGEHQFQDHVFRDPESRLRRIEAVERRERLRDQDLPVHRVVELGDIGDVGAAIPQELRNGVERLPALPPQSLRQLEEVAVFQVVDRVVVGHRIHLPWLLSACGCDSFFAVGRRVWMKRDAPVNQEKFYRESCGVHSLP